MSRRDELSEEVVREKARETGIEGYIARKDPELYEFLKTEAKASGLAFTEYILGLLKWAYEIRTYTSFITKQDLENIKPECLYSALRFLQFFEKQYFNILAYAQVSAVTQIYTIVEQIMAMRRMETPRPTETGLPPLPPPTPSTVQRIVDAILRAIEMFTVGRPDVSSEIARKVAQELIRLTSQAPQTEASAQASAQASSQAQPQAQSSPQ